jgi:hypothetical protein
MTARVDDAEAGGSHLTDVRSCSDDELTELQNEAPRWSPVDDWLLSITAGGEPCEQELRVIDATTGTVLWSAGADEAAWSPDGRHVAYQSPTDGTRAEVVLADAATGSAVARLTLPAADLDIGGRPSSYVGADADWGPEDEMQMALADWSDDGAWIAMLVGWLPRPYGTQPLGTTALLLWSPGDGRLHHVATERHGIHSATFVPGTSVIAYLPVDSRQMTGGPPTFNAETSDRGSVAAMPSRASRLAPFLANQEHSPDGAKLVLYRPMDREPAWTLRGPPCGVVGWAPSPAR